MAEQRLADLNFAALTHRHFHPSPTAWEDQVLYFLMLDRFSDGKEQGGYCDNDGNPVTAGSTPLFRPSDAGNAITTDQDAEQWRKAGGCFVGGTLKGLMSKIGYLKRMGISAIWVSPIFKQIASQPQSYHGYAIQHFLDVDPHFGTRDDLRDLVDTAHKHDIYVILDIIFNHTGDVFAYNADRYLTPDGRGGDFMDPRWDGKQYQIQGYRDQAGAPTLPFGKIDLTANPQAWPDAAIWPTEFQDAGTFTRKGRISNWDYDPEYREGDFEALKDIHHGTGEIDSYQPSDALRAVCQVYKFWIAFADLDGFRIDTVKHMDLGATRYFASVIHEFAQSIGKENFYLIGEITGSREQAVTTLDVTGIDAALGIADVQDKMEYMVKGYRNPTDYFSLFRNSELVNKESHIWFRNKVVTQVDDHDKVIDDGYKTRFCADRNPPDRNAPKVLLNVLALNATTLGIPCIYYGSEQYFDGQGGDDDYIREAMFGGEFGAFRSRERHFFNEDSPAYYELATILNIRRQSIVLRRGRQYLREISGDGVNFGLPQMIGGEIRSVVPWSRIFNDREMVVAINTDHNQPRTAWVTIDNDLHSTGNMLRCIYSTDATQIESTTPIEPRNGKAALLRVPAAGFVIFEPVM